jgi:TRAP-type transport system small permease protein
MMFLIDRIHLVLRVIVGGLFCLLMVAVMFQVVTRLMLPKPPIWTEELSRFCLIMITAFGAGLALRSGELVGVDLLTAGLGRKGKALIEGIGMLLVMAFCVALIAPGLEFVDIGAIQTSPALGWNMFWMHLAVVLAPLTLALACVERLLAMARDLREPV